MSSPVTECGDIHTRITHKMTGDIVGKNQRPPLGWETETVADAFWSAMVSMGPLCLCRPGLRPRRPGLVNR